MGRDKASLPLGRDTFLSHLVRTYRTAFPVHVSMAYSGQFDPCGAGELADLRPGQGPLAGLEAAFAATDADIVFLTATDLPCGTSALAEKLCALLGDADACVIRRSDGTPEPAFAVYSRACAPMVTECLNEHRRSFRAMLSRVNVRWVEEAELPEYDLPALLRNVNTPEEYAAIQEVFPHAL